MHRKHHHHHPQIPQPQQPYHAHHTHELALDPAGRTFLPSPREMYSPISANGHQTTGVCVKRVPPQVPERSPDTHLSTGRKSSASSKDSSFSLDLCQELNEVLEASQHHSPHHSHHHYAPSPSSNPNSNRYADSRPFAYAVGIDVKLLQQQRFHGSSANGNPAGKTRGVPEGYSTVESPQGELASRGFQPYSEYRKIESKPQPVPQGSVNGIASSSQAEAFSAGWKGAQTYDATGSSSFRQPFHAGQYPPPAPAQMYGGQRVSQPPPGGLGSPRHVHTHHHIVTKPHPSPPASRRGSSDSPARSHSPVSSAFQPVTSSSTSQGTCSSPPPQSSFPAPPPPLPIHDRYLAATQETRSPSPPLPPPPSDLGTSATPRGGKSASGVAALVPVLAAATQKGTSAKGQQRSRSESRGAVAQSPVRDGACHLHSPSGHYGNTGHPATIVNSAMMAELTHAKLRKTEFAVPANNDTRQVQQEPERSQSPLGIRLKPTNGKFSNIYQEQVPQASGEITVLPLLILNLDELDPPPPPPPAVIEPPPPPIAPPAPPLATGLLSYDVAESQLVAILSRMEIEIPDDIDISQCPGLVEITKATPNWKRDMIEKKNKEKIEEYVKQILKDREQQAKWRNVPDWKRALLVKKDQEDQEAALAAYNAPSKKTPAPPPKVASSDAPPPMPKPKGDIVPAALSIDPAELESMPPWKRELLFKREKVPITFSNEFNPDDENQEAGQTEQS